MAHLGGILVDPIQHIQQMCAGQLQQSRTHYLRWQFFSRHADGGLCGTHGIQHQPHQLVQPSAIYLCIADEKDETASTDLYSLVEFKDASGVKVRNDRSYEKDYINGRYGAIPYL